MSTGRLEAFSDGVFAVAITLLVLDIRVPAPEQIPGGSNLLGTLLRQWPIYLAYVTSFLTILVMWVNHHHIFSHIHRSDHYFLIVNGFLLMGISVVPFSTALLAEYLQHSEGRVAAAVYSGTFVLVALLFNLWWRYTARNRRLLRASADERFVTSVSRQYLLAPIVYAAAFGLAFVSAWASFGVCMLLALFFALPIGHRAALSANTSDAVPQARESEEPWG